MTVLALAGAFVFAPPSGPAAALDLLGFLGFGSDKPPTPSAAALPYEVTIDGADAKGVEQAVKDASNLYKLRNEAPAGGEALVFLAESDLPRVLDALWGLGYYDATVEIEVAGVRLRLGGGPNPAAPRAAEAYRNRAPVPVRVVVQTGREFTLRRIAVIDGRTGGPFPPAEMPQRVIGLNPGDPAHSADILAAQSRMVDRLRDLSHPFAKVSRLEPVVDHPAGAMDVTFTVTPGPVARLGPITMSGLTTVDPAPVRSFIYAEQGDPYSPAELAGIRKSLARVEALGSIRIREADKLDANGELPVFVELTERKMRAVGASALYSTIDGPQLNAYWTHRNLFGGAETLRLEGSVFQATRNDGEPLKSIQDLTWADLGWRLGFTFMKPGLWGTRTDLLASAAFARESTDAYVARHVGGDLALRYRWTDLTSAQAGLRFDRGQASNVQGQIDYTLVGLPVSVTYDSTDRPLDPTRGIRATASLTPYPSFLGSTVNMTIGRAGASAYWSVDEDSDIILAGRVGFGTLLGADIDAVPANYRFYAGGGGSVRGYKYQSLSPRIGLDPTGGLSLLDGSVEARIKVTDTIGIVPFVDAGMAYENRYPDFKETLGIGAGVGLRYYTPIGPIRLDVAVPLNKRAGDRPVTLYIGVGQAF
ncbi:autotransporter assembly complex protein TamA [Alsobacter sp. SYSU M60028]|uniref:Autotransporter assembly complex protein TamA n=1 Tax=Alsobacter ponti TaxID=2962936 RepID=A0ABT1L8Q6_9HYPH|nr:autotransporter assembly complex family protein [Alsobacter ponti]MCP8937872.1 autotransporter assembly complex protein TamA [Alsobacter ponti]